MRWEDGFGCWKSHVRATWSVTTSEGRPSKYGRDFFSDFSAPLSNRDSQAITCSSSTVSCVRRAHKPRSLASVYILKGLLKSGVINTVACTRSYLTVSNACWHCSIQIQVAFFFLVVQLSLKSGELMWYQPANPKNLWTSLMDCMGNDLTAETLEGSVFTPSPETIWLMNASDLWMK